MAGTIQYKETQTGGSVQFKEAAFPNLGTRGLQGPSVASASVGYVTLEEHGFATDHLTKVTITALPVTLANTTGISFGSKQLITFPLGKIHIISANVEDFLWDYTDDDGNVTPITGTMGGDFSLGSSATADATLNGTEVNILASTSYDPFSAAVSANSGINVILDGSSTAASVYLNATIDDADVADAASDILDLTCTMWFKWYWMAG
jgi:hypothetical protein